MLQGGKNYDTIPVYVGKKENNYGCRYKEI